MSWQGNPGNYIEHLECDTQVICSGTNGESFSLNNAQYSAPANQQIRVILGVDATLWASGAGTVSATLDPIFSIDPGFANAGQYSLVISPDVTQAGPQNAQAPEPASAGLAGTGLAAAIWFVLRSRRSS